MLNNKGIKFFLIIMLLVFAVGVIVGSVYASGISHEAAEDMSRYLSVFFEKDMRNSSEVAISSFLNNIKVFLVIFLSGFFRFGVPFTLGVCCMEGFTSGFTCAALSKIWGLKGFFVSLSSILSVLIFVGNMIFFGAVSMKYSLLAENEGKFSKKNYIILSVCAFAIFSVAAIFDGYITTIFMDTIVKKM